jgi:hypothetical protein
MNREEYERSLKKLKSQYDEQLTQLHKQYALANNTVKIGDIVKDHMGSIQVEKMHIAWPFGSNIPEVVYHGLELKKDGTPKKNAVKREAWQSNLITKQDETL